MHIHQTAVAEGMDGADERLLDPGWLARMLAMPEPPTPPSRQKRCSAAPGGPLPDLFCDEIMPKMTSWPPLHKPCGSIEGNANISFGEGSTMNNYLLDRLIDECWPDTPS